MKDSYEKFHVGINVFVVKDRQLLLGKRRNVYGAGTWGLPGGHLEVGEAMEEAAGRELKEETGLQAETLKFANLVNDKDKDQHYLQIGFVAEDFQGEPTVEEPDRCEEWRWFEIDNLPQEIFPAHKKQIELFFKKLPFSDS